jgi:DNA-binding transcriptional ArsR family regulator
MKPAASAAPWDLVRDMNRATALLDPLRLRILDALREPDSASGLARRFGLPRQKMNYHIRELARAHFLERAGQRRRRNMIERRYRATAQAYVLSPELLGRMGLPREHTEDAFSAAYLLGLMAVTPAARPPNTTKGSLHFPSTPSCALKARSNARNLLPSFTAASLT